MDVLRRPLPAGHELAADEPDPAAGGGAVVEDGEGVARRGEGLDRSGTEMDGHGFCPFVALLCTDYTLVYSAA
jgi:hypothetical protein